jgi:hypothetical protein
VGLISPIPRKDGHLGYASVGGSALSHAFLDRFVCAYDVYATMCVRRSIKRHSCCIGLHLNMNGCVGRRSFGVVRVSYVKASPHLARKAQPQLLTREPYNMVQCNFQLPTTPYYAAIICTRFASHSGGTTIGAISDEYVYTTGLCFPISFRDQAMFT